MQKLANNLGVGPKFYKKSDNFILMEVVEGCEIPEWIRKLKGVGSKSSLRSIIKEVLDQCLRLDNGGIDHGELSNLKKHIIVGEKVSIIDFESSAIHRRMKNLTSAAQYLFIGGPVANKVRRMLGIKSMGNALNSLRRYKYAMDCSYSDSSKRESYQILLMELKLDV